MLARVEGEIDRRLRTVVVGLTRDERVRIGVAEELAIFILRDEIRVFARNIRDLVNNNVFISLFLVTLRIRFEYYLYNNVYYKLYFREALKNVL